MSWEVATKENKWQGRNITRWQNEEYDKLYQAAEGELDPVKRAALFIKMNELVVDDHASSRSSPGRAVAAMSQQAACRASGWDNDLWSCRTGTARREASAGSAASADRR